MNDATTHALSRRKFLILSAAGAGVLLLPLRAARAQGVLSTQQAAAFVSRIGQHLVSIVGGPGTEAQKQAALRPVIASAVDVNGVGRFVLGRFWRVATPVQRQEYLDLFRTVLMNSITGRIGDYAGVRFAVGRATAAPGGVQVATVVSRPNNPAANVIWVIRDVGGGPKIVDVIAEGTSLRVTQRDDYASYLSRNNDNVQALINAMRRQVGQG